MFTVVIIEQTHLDSIEQYRPFLKPFLDQSGIGFCRWRQNGKTLEETVPELYDTVSRHGSWRAIVVCDDEGKDQKNPFDRVPYVEPERTPEMSLTDFCALRREKKEEAFRQAAKKPLTKLMTWLCQSPIVTEGRNNCREDDPEFAEYLDEFYAKEALRRQIIGDRLPEIALPKEVICVARRCFEREAADIRHSWENNPDIRYSRFYDWNLYYDKMRYLIFDTLPENHRNYEFDYIRFLYTLMLLAQNEVPMGALNPNRVYTLECHDDESALQRLLLRYDNKLALTQEHLDAEIRKLKSKEMPRLSDRDAEMIFRSGVSVPVVLSNEFDRSTLYISRDGIGLSTDCPQDEYNAWETGLRDSRKALGRFLKLPRRSLRKAASDMRRMDTADMNHALQMNDFQLEDVADYVADEEMRMVNTHTCNLYDMKRYTKQLAPHDKKVRSVIETRMTRRRTVAVGIAALCCFLAGYIPMFVTNAKTLKSFLFSLLFTAVGVAVMVLTCLLTLRGLRKPLRSAYSGYNGAMRAIDNEVEGSLAGYSRYLSHACNVMRGNSVLNFCRENENPDEAYIRVMKKHAADLEGHREELRDVFGMFMPEKVDPQDQEEYFRYDFNRPVDFAYPIPFTEDQITRIEFMQKGNHVYAPVDFVKRISIRREELYDV